MSGNASVRGQASLGGDRRRPAAGRRLSRDAPQSQLAPRAERDLVRAAQAGDGDARAELVVAFQPRIAGVARIYRRSSRVGRAELMQEGTVGLLRALRRYDAGIGTPFWAYASWWVRQAMQQLIAELSGAVTLSDRAQRALARVNQTRRDYLRANGREPTGAELAAGTGLARSRVDELIVADRPARGLAEPVGREEGAATLGEMVPDPGAEEAYEHVPQHMAIDRLPDVLGRLSARDRTIVDGRFGLGGPQRTLRELGAALGVSAERVRQLEQRALRRLRDELDPDPVGSG